MFVAPVGGVDGCMQLDLDLGSDLGGDVGGGPAPLLQAAVAAGLNHRGDAAATLARCRGPAARAAAAALRRRRPVTGLHSVPRGGLSGSVARRHRGGLDDHLWVEHDLVRG